MKILLLAPNYGRENYTHVPLGLMYISSYLKQKGHSVDALNLNHYPESKLREVLQTKTYDAVGTGGLFVHMRQMISIIREVRQLAPGARIFLGGAIASADPEFILPELKPDFLVLGEGEKTADLLLRALDSGGDIHQVTGIAFIENGQVIKTPPTPLIENLDELPFPDYEGFEYDVYLDHYYKPRTEQYFCALKGNDFISRPGSPISSRDCVCRCTFCFRITGGNFRLRSIANFMAEIRYLIDRYQINVIAISDEMFILNKERVREACQALKSLGLPWSCQARVPTLNDDVLAMLKDAGCYLLSMGFESASPVVLKSMKKGISPSQIERAIQGCIKAKLCIQGNFIFGDPAETLETMEETIKFFRKLPKINVGWSNVSPYPGTSIYYDLIRSGRLKDLRTHHIEPNSRFHNMTKLSDIDFDYMMKKVQYERYRQERFQYARVSVLGKKPDGRHALDIYCSFCGNLNENCHLDLNLHSVLCHIICKHCFQRTFINKGDPRFFDLNTFMHQIYYWYIVRWMIINPHVFRISSVIRRFVSFVKRLLSFQRFE